MIWEDKVFAIPLWANTQVLWYRKSLAKAAGLDLSQPVTWEQVIKAAADNNGSVGVQANKYEAYVVLINALVQGAGGDIVSDTEAGRDTKVDIDSEAGKKAAEVIKMLADSEAAQSDLSVSNEGTSLGRMFPADPSAPQGAGEFMTNWTFVYKLYEGQIEIGRDHQGAVRRPRLRALPGDGRGRGLQAPDRRHRHRGRRLLRASRTSRWRPPCASPRRKAQVDLALNNGLMPSTNSAYDEVAASGDFPEDLIELYRTSVDQGGPRPKSAFYALISSAIQSRWHSPDSVDPDSTPKDSADYLQDVLEGKALL